MSEKNSFERFKENFGVFVNAITAPENESDFDFDDTSADDIFSNESSYTAKSSYMSDSPKNHDNLKESEDYVIYTDPDPEPLYISADLTSGSKPRKLYSDSKAINSDNQQSPDIFGNKTEELDADLIKAHYESIVNVDSNQSEINSDSENVIYTAPKPEVKKNPNQKQITVSDIMRAKNMGIEKKHISLEIGNNSQPYVSEKELEETNEHFSLDEVFGAVKVNVPIKSEKDTSVPEPEPVKEETNVTISEPETAKTENNISEPKPETIKTEKSIPVPETDTLKTETNTSVNKLKPIKSEMNFPSDSAEQLESKKKEISGENKKPIDKNSAEDLPGGEGISIVPWNRKAESENSDKTEQKQKKEEIEEIDISKLPPVEKVPESVPKREPMRYTADKEEPFIVMVGKFTVAVRTEYDNIRKYNVNNASKPKPSDTVSTSQVRRPPVQNAAANNQKNKNTASEIPASKNQTVKNTSPQSAENTVQSNHNQKQKLPIFENINSIKRPAAKSNKVSPDKKKKKASYIFRSMFSSYEEYEESNDEIIEERPQLDDYRNINDASAVRGEIGDNFQKVLIKTAVLLALTVISIIVTIVVQASPSLFLNLVKNGWLVYGLINLVLLVVSVFVGKNPIFNGFATLRHFKFNAETPLAVASLACCIQAIAGVFLPNIFVNGTYHLYSSLLIFALFLNHFGKLLMIWRTADNFNFFTQPKNNFAGKIYTDEHYAGLFARNIPSNPIIAYFKRSKVISNFLQLSYAPDPVEDLAEKIAPFGIAFSVLSGIAYGIIFRDLVGGICSFAISACISTPMCCLIAINIPLKQICSNSLKNGAMIVGYETVKQFCDTNAVMIDSTQLYPEGSIFINGVKTYNQTKFYDALRGYAAVMVSVNSPVKYAFDKFIPEGVGSLPKVESVVYDEGCGLTAWINGQRMLIGNRELMKKHNIKIPNKTEEDKYRSEGKEIVYVSVSGELVVMFMLIYKTDMRIARELRSLEESGVNLIVRNIDQVITEDFIAEKFKLYPRCIRVLPTGLGNVCNEVLTSKEQNSRAYLVTDGKISSFARAVTNCILIKPIVPLLKVLQTLSIVIGMILVTAISFMSGFAKLGSIELLIYIVFWCLAAIVISALLRKVIR